MNQSRSITPRARGSTRKTAARSSTAAPAPWSSMSARAARRSRRSPPHHRQAQLHRAGVGFRRAREAGCSARAMDSAGDQPLLFHQRRFRGGRDGDQVRDALSEGARASRRRKKSSRASFPIMATRWARFRPAAACAALTTSTCCSTGRKFRPRFAIDARGARPIPRAISIAPTRSRRKSGSRAPTTSRRSSPSR